MRVSIRLLHVWDYSARCCDVIKNTATKRSKIFWQPTYEDPFFIFLFLIRGLPFSIQWLVGQFQHSTRVWSLPRIYALFSYTFGKKKPSPSQVLIMSFDSPSPCLHAYTTCIITYKMFGYVGSITNHNLWHRYHIGNILIALWCNSYAHEIRFTVELQFYQKLQRDH